MSDYLSDLVARALGTAGALRPRLPSRYEPDEPGGIGPAAFEPATGPSEDAESAAHDAPLTETRRARRMRAVSRAPLQGVTDGSEEGVGRDVTPRPASLRGKGEHTASQEVKTENERAGSERTKTLYTSPFLRRERGEAGEGVRSPAPGHGVVVHPAVSAQHETPAPAREASQPAEPSPPSPAPTIEVTIGRIEVRATSAPGGPAPKPPTPTAVMSLDEYLRRRAEEREG